MHTTVLSEPQVQFSQSQKADNEQHPLSQLLAQYEYPQPTRGDFLQGEIIRIREDVVYVDVGAKRDAMVPYEEVERLDDELLANLSRGDEVPVYVTRTPIGDEQLLVSLDRGLQKMDWEKAEKLYENGEVIDLIVSGHNKGGLTVEFNRLQGFVPNSHVTAISRTRNSQERQRYKAKQIGNTMSLKIIEVDQSRDRFVLSETAVQSEQRQHLLNNLQQGQIVTGEVVNIKDYGVFVDIGQGLTGLLHISQMVWDKVDHPADIFSIGDEVKVMIEKVDRERERISLNRKALLPDPWQKFVADHQDGDLVSGVVTTLVDFGAFVELTHGVEGLLHKNEINMPYDAEPADVLHKGDSVLVRILSIQPTRKQLSLSMRRVSAAEEMAWLSSKALEDQVGEVVS